MYSTIGLAYRTKVAWAPRLPDGTEFINTFTIPSTNAEKPARFEWFRDEDGTRVGLNSACNPNNAPFPGNFYSLSAGLNWTPTGNLVLRPELRADWYDGDAAPAPYQDGTRDSQFMLGLDAILMF